MSWAKYSGYHFATKIGFAPGAYVTTSANGSAIDRSGYAHLLATQQVVIAGGSSVTEDTSIQDSANGSTGWADYTPDVIYANNDTTVTTAKFPQVTTDGIAKLDVDLSKAKRYIRFVKTLGGANPQVYVTVDALLDQADRADQPGATA